MRPMHAFSLKLENIDSAYFELKYLILRLFKFSGLIQMVYIRLYLNNFINEQHISSNFTDQAYSTWRSSL